MTKQIFINLPVKDLNRSIEFFTALGYTFNAQYTNESATCMIIGENMFAMLLVEKFFSTFTNKQIADASKTVEVITALAVDTRQEVDDMMAKAIAAGAIEHRPPADHGWMYQRSFQDIDGHLWELFYADPAGMPQQ